MIDLILIWIFSIFMYCAVGYSIVSAAEWNRIVADRYVYNRPTSEEKKAAAQKIVWTYYLFGVLCVLGPFGLFLIIPATVVGLGYVAFKIAKHVWENLKFYREVTKN